MTIVSPGVVSAWGILFPSSVLRSELFGVLAAFVAINTLVYTALAVAKMLPKLYVSDWVSHRNRRSETRSIHPDPAPGRPVALPASAPPLGPRSQPPATADPWQRPDRRQS